MNEETKDTFIPLAARRYGALRTRLLEQGKAALTKHLNNAWHMRRVIATPPGANMGEIRKIYADARKLTRMTGNKYRVDHIVPLHHELVCGLHVAANLRIVLERDDMAKGSTWSPEGESYDRAA